MNIFRLDPSLEIVHPVMLKSWQRTQEARVKIAQREAVSTSEYGKIRDRVIFHAKSSSYRFATYRLHDAIQKVFTSSPALINLGDTPIIPLSVIVPLTQGSHNYTLNQPTLTSNSYTPDYMSHGLQAPRKIGNNLDGEWRVATDEEFLQFFSQVDFMTLQDWLDRFANLKEEVI